MHTWVLLRCYRLYSCGCFTNGFNKVSSQVAEETGMEETIFSWLHILFTFQPCTWVYDWLEDYL